MNKCVFIGRLTRDPEVSSTRDGKKIAKFGLAVPAFRGGEKTADFIDCVAWEKSAEIIENYVAKGDQIAVVTQARLETWKDKNTDQNRSKITFHVQEVSLLGGKKEEDAAPATTSRRSSRPASRQEPEAYDDPNAPALDDNDIPF